LMTREMGMARWLAEAETELTRVSTTGTT